MFFKTTLITFPILFRNLTGKNFGLPASFLGKVENTPFYVSIENFWGQFFERKKTFLCHFWTTTKNFSIVRTVTYVSRETHWWSFFRRNNVIFFHFRLLNELFSFLSKDFPHNCQNWILRVHRKPWKKNNFFWKNFRCSYRFRKWANNFCLLAKFFGRVEETAFDLSMGYFWEIFLKKKSDIFKHSRTLSKPFSAFIRRFLGRVVRKHYPNFQSYPDTERTISSLMTRKSSRAVKTAFHVFTGTIWK